MKNKPVFIVESSNSIGGVETIIELLKYECETIIFKNKLECLKAFLNGLKTHSFDERTVILNQPFSSFLFLLFYNPRNVFYILHINFFEGKILRKIFARFFLKFLKFRKTRLITWSYYMSIELKKYLPIVFNPPVFRSDKTEKIKSVNWNNREIDFLFLGRLEFQKGADLLPKISDKLNNKLNIIGKGSIMFEESNKLKYLGEKKLDEVYAFLSNTKVLIMPSRFEGLGLVILEALRFGCNVVAFDCKYGPKDLSNIFKTNIYLSKVDDIDDFSLKALKALREKPKQIDINLFNNFSEKNFIQQLNNAINHYNPSL